LLNGDVVKYGETPDGKQRFNCFRQTFILDYSYKGHLPEVKEQIIEMTLNGSGIRDISRVLQISPTTVINELKKKRQSYNKSIKNF
jgi:transposase-like protein